MERPCPSGAYPTFACNQITITFRPDPHTSEFLLTAETFLDAKPKPSETPYFFQIAGVESKSTAQMTPRGHEHLPP